MFANPGRLAAAQYSTENPGTRPGLSLAVPGIRRMLNPYQTRVKEKPWP
jgi:hypothetical protein